MSGFTKLFQSILTSSIWCEDHATVRVWVAMLASADKNGLVEGSVPGFARIANVTIDEMQAALKKFLSPDPHSRTKECDGRRIEEVRGGWLLLNYKAHRDGEMPGQKSRAEYMREYRRKHGGSWPTPKRRAALLERDGHRCRHCGATDGLEVDHIVEREDGGTDNDDNLQILCKPCNLRKRNEARQARNARNARNSPRNTEAEAEAEAESEMPCMQGDAPSALPDALPAPPGDRLDEYVRCANWIRGQIPDLSTRAGPLLAAVQARGREMPPAKLKTFVEDAVRRAKHAKNPPGYLWTILGEGTKRPGKRR